MISASFISRALSLRASNNRNFILDLVTESRVFPDLTCCINSSRGSLLPCFVFTAVNIYTRLIKQKDVTIKNTFGVEKHKLSFKGVNIFHALRN